MLLVGFVVWSSSFFTFILDFKTSNVDAPSPRILIHTVKYSSCIVQKYQTGHYHLNMMTGTEQHYIVTTLPCTCFISVIVCADATVCNH